MRLSESNETGIMMLCSATQLEAHGNFVNQQKASHFRTNQVRNLLIGIKILVICKHARLLVK